MPARVSRRSTARAAISSARFAVRYRREAALRDTAYLYERPS